MDKKRGDNQLEGELNILKQRLDALEFKITSFDELENKIFDFFSSFEDKVNEIIDKKLVNLKTDENKDDKKYEELSKEVKELSKQAKSIVSSLSKTKGGKAIDFEKLLNARIEDLKENLMEKFDNGFFNNSKKQVSQDFVKFKDAMNLKVNNISKEFDDFQKETVPMEYVNMLEAEFRNKLRDLKDTLSEIKSKLPLDKNKLMVTEQEFDEFRKEVNDFRIKELIPEKESLDNVHEEVEKIRQRINSIKEDELVPLELGKVSRKKKFAGKDDTTGNANEINLIKEKLTEINHLQDEISEIKDKLNEKPLKSSNENVGESDSLKKDLGLLQDQINKFDSEISEIKDKLNERPLKNSNENVSESDSLKKDLELLQDQINDIRDESLSKRQQEIPDKRIEVIENSINNLKNNMDSFHSQIEALKNMALTPKERKEMNKNEEHKENYLNQVQDVQNNLNGFYKEFQEFRSYSVEQISKISEWLTFLNRCIK